MSDSPKEKDQSKISEADKLVAGRAAAALTIMPGTNAATTLEELGTPLGRPDFDTLVTELNDLCQDTVSGDLSRGEEMLTAQAATLDALFHHLTRVAIGNRDIEYGDRILKLAFRAQAQCRSTWEAISAVQNPPQASFVRQEIGQQNIANGPQQVNNGTPSGATRGGKNQKLKSKLLEDHDVEWMDTGEKGPSCRVDQNLATVGKIHRPKNPSRKG
jgi:hypothetical protein